MRNRPIKKKTCMRVVLRGIVYFMLISCQSQMPYANSPLLSASFSLGSSLPTAGQPKQFADTSTGSPTSWQWDFGDGVASTSQNPNHAYAAQGSYSVTLTIGSGSASASIGRTINVESGEVYWVSPTGTATWASAYSATALSGSACCSLSTACANAVAGDTVILRGGTYNAALMPSHSGTSLAKIIWIAYPGETPTLHNNAPPGSNYYYYGICLWSVSWHKIDGIDVDNPPATEIPWVNGGPMGRPLAIYSGASYNEIVNCDINANRNGSIQWWRGNQPNPPVTNNWMHNCTIRNTGHLYASGVPSDPVYATMGLQIGVPTYDSASGNNTVEDCVFYAGGHHDLEVFTLYNVFKNNYFHNEGNEPNNTGATPLYGPDSVSPAAAPNLWGHRLFQFDNESGLPRQYQLFEGNRCGYSGPPSEDDGGDGMTIMSPGNIIRYNDVYASQNNGVLFKHGSLTYENADDNRFYNNTIFYSGRYNNIGAPYLANLWEGYSFRWYGSYAFNKNVIINNIMNTYGGTQEISTLGSGTNRVENNFLTANGNPRFIDTTATDPTNAALPNLALQAGSPCIGAAENLTTAVGSGSNSATLVVADALFFQDGTWGSALTHGVTLFPDWIAIGSVTNIVKISSINYTTNTITLASSMTWGDKAKIWLYSDSRGRRVLYGTGPDIGAHAYGSQ